MTYQKPVIVLAGSAACAIQGTKPVGGYSDMNPTKKCQNRGRVRS